MRLQSAQIPCGTCASSKPFKAIALRRPLSTLCENRISTCFQQCGEFHPELFRSKGRTLFTARSKTRLHFDTPQNPAQAEAEDDSKIKDRWEALLFAETLQGTLSPNANPGKGSVGGLLNWMPKATATIQRAAQTLSHLSSARSFIPNRPALRKGGIKKVIAGVQRDF